MRVAAVERLEDVVVVAKDVGQLEHRHLRDQRRQRRRGDRAEVDGAELDLLGDLALAAERAGMVVVDLDLAARTVRPACRRTAVPPSDVPCLGGLTLPMLRSLAWAWAARCDPAAAASTSRATGNRRRLVIGISILPGICPKAPGHYCRALFPAILRMHGRIRQAMTCERAFRIFECYSRRGTSAAQSLLLDGCRNRRGRDSRHAASKSARRSAAACCRAGLCAMGAQAADQDPGRLRAGRHRRYRRADRGRHHPAPARLSRHRRQQDRRRRLHRAEAGRRSRRPTATRSASASWASSRSGRSCRARRSRSISTRSWCRSAIWSACRWR